MDTFFTRTEQLIGKDKAQLLSQKHVAVFGLGGVGSYVAEALARAGIGRLTLVDFDKVDITNINRQLIALHSTVGKSKAEVCKTRLLDINPSCVITAVNELYTPESRERFFCESYDFIVDAIDMVSAKTDLIVTAYERNIPVISSMGTGNKLHPEMFKIADIYKTTVCPLCRVMRRELKLRGVKKLTVVYSEEEPKKADTSSKNPASISFVPGAAGLIIAGEVIRRLAELE